MNCATSSPIVRARRIDEAGVERLAGLQQRGDLLEQLASDDERSAIGDGGVVLGHLRRQAPPVRGRRGTAQRRVQRREPVALDQRGGGRPALLDARGEPARQDAVRRRRRPAGRDSTIGPQRPPPPIGQNIVRCAQQGFGGAVAGPPA
jgi:hypothetical protein